MVFYSRASIHTCRDGRDCQGSNEEDDCVCHGAVVYLGDRYLLIVIWHQARGSESVTSAWGVAQSGVRGSKLVNAYSPPVLTVLGYVAYYVTGLWRISQCIM